MHGTFDTLAKHSGAKHSGNCERTLRDFLAYSDALLKSLHDPVYGPIGPEALERFLATGCQEHTALGPATSFATYIPFQGPGNPSVVNAIFYHTHYYGTPRTYQGMAISRHHEIAHACAWNGSAALHASPYNGAADIIMSPWDWLRMVERTEEDAFVKQGWLSALAAKTDPIFRDLSVWDPVSADMFDEVRASTLTLEHSFSTLAKRAMERTGSYRYDTGEATDFRGYYRSYALWQYEHMIVFLESRGVRPRIVRLEPQHHAAMGRSFGPVLKPSEPEGLCRQDAEKMRDIRERLKIGQESDLPYFEEALAASGERPEDFLARSRGAARKTIVRDAGHTPKALALA